VRFTPFALALALALIGCTKRPTPTTPSGDAVVGAERYGALCAGCHGPTARGGIGGPIVPWKRGEPALVDKIATTMPPDDPSKCDRTCATAIAAWLLSLPPDEEELVCDTYPAATRQLRLLTRREYANTLRDLVGGPALTARTCTSDANCTIRTESCVRQACVTDSCDTVTFVWPANGRRPTSVHVAGSFNSWPASPAAGGWALTYVQGMDAYVSKRSVPPGTHQYKFVIDGQWQVDDTNTNSAPDGFGGQNSILNVSCTTPGSTAGNDEFTAGLPLESRPKGYWFDSNAQSGLVTSGHVEAQLSIAAKAAARVGSPCRPTGADRQPCATQFVRTFGRRAFRRPLTAEEQGVYVAAIVAAPDFDAGLKQATELMFSSPHFLYRSELGERTPDGRYRLTPFEVATALSYSLWGTTPDETLLNAAEAGRLATPDDISREARRMLGDSRARDTMRVFAEQWLGLERLSTVDKAPTLFPAFTPALREALRQEAPSFVEHVVFDGTGKYDELLTANYGLVQPALASFYGLTGGAGASKVTLPAERAAGLLGQASMLAAYAHSDQSSPVKRGVFVREHLLCQDFPPPPANAGGVPRVDPNATTRERFAQHASDPSCKSCHQYIDDVGFGFEGFDAIGGIRTKEAGRTIDTSGTLRDVERFGAGTVSTFTTLPQLGTQLAASNRAKACFATAVWRLTRGRLEKPSERCTVKALGDGFVAAGGDIRQLFINALTDERFLFRTQETQ
jgi:hypothetical protein